MDIQDVGAQGAVIGGDAQTGGGNLTGRDAQTVNVNNYDGRIGTPVPFEKQMDTLSIQFSTLSRQFVDVNQSVLRLIILIDGDQRYGSPGLREQMKEALDNKEAQAALERRVHALSWRVTISMIVNGIFIAELVLRNWTR